MTVRYRVFPFDCAYAYSDFFGSCEVVAMSIDPLLSDIKFNNFILSNIILCLIYLKVSNNRLICNIIEKLVIKYITVLFLIMKLIFIIEI